MEVNFSPSLLIFKLNQFVTSKTSKIKFEPKNVSPLVTRKSQLLDKIIRMGVALHTFSLLLHI